MQHEVRREAAEKKRGSSSGQPPRDEPGFGVAASFLLFVAIMSGLVVMIIVVHIYADRMAEEGRGFICSSGHCLEVLLRGRRGRSSFISGYDDPMSLLGRCYSVLRAPTTTTKKKQGRMRGPSIYTSSRSCAY